MKPELIQSPYRAPPAVDLSTAELDLHLRRAHRLRALEFNRVLKIAARGFKALYRRFKQARERRVAIAELRRLDERTLKDIGIERSEIPLIVEQLLKRREADGEPQRAYPLRALVAPAARGAAAEDDQCCPPLAA